MNRLAQTYPQLVIQAKSLGIDNKGLLYLKDSYDLVEAHFHSFFRAQGTSLTSHLVRTGSILLAAGQDLKLARAGMVHALYVVHVFVDSQKKKPSESIRSKNRLIFGTELEEFLWNYGKAVPFGYERFYDKSSINHLSEKMQMDLLALFLANDLEDHLDQAAAFMELYQNDEEIEARHLCSMALAYDLGHDSIAETFKASLHQYQSNPIDSSLKRCHIIGYDLSGKYIGRKSATWRFLAKTKRKMIHTKSVFLGGIK